MFYGHGDVSAYIELLSRSGGCYGGESSFGGLLPRLLLPVMRKPARGTHDIGLSRGVECQIVRVYSRWLSVALHFRGRFHRNMEIMASYWAQWVWRNQVSSLWRISWVIHCAQLPTPSIKVLFFHSAAAPRGCYQYLLLCRPISLINNTCAKCTDCPDLARSAAICIDSNISSATMSKVGKGKP